MCSTANCEWPTIPTLGICSACENVKGRMKITNGSSFPPFLNYTLSLGGNLTYPDRNSITINVADVNTFFTLSSATPGGINQGHFPVGRQVFATVYALGFPASAPPNMSLEANQYNINQSKIDQSVVAHACSLYFCLQAYNATSNNNSLNQRFVETWDPMVETGPNPYNISTWEMGWRNQTSWSFSDVPDSMNAANASAYGVDFVSRYILAWNFMKTFTGTVEYNPFGGTFWFSETGAQSAVIRAMWSAANTTSTMSDKMQVIADSFIAYMRTDLPAAPDKRYAPSVGSLEIFVRVRWPWIAYPLSLVLAGYAYLIATIYQTRRRAVRPWKGQRLPLLFAEVDDELREFAADGLNSRLHDRTDRIRVQMDFNGSDVLSFRQVKQEQPQTAHLGDSSAKLL